MARYSNKIALDYAGRERVREKFPNKTGWDASRNLSLSLYRFTSLPYFYLDVYSD
jgi:hypothetical protein